MHKLHQAGALRLWTAFYALWFCFVSGIFVLFTVGIFNVAVGSGTWLFALFVSLALTITATLMVLWTNHSRRVKIVMLCGAFVTTAISVALGIRYRPFDMQNIRFGALLDDLDYLPINTDLPVAPAEVSYRKFLPDVQNQGACDSCWALAGAGMLSTRAVMMKVGRGEKLVSETSAVNDQVDVARWLLSPQALIEADSIENGVGKCHGASITRAFELAGELASSMLKDACEPLYSGNSPVCDLNNSPRTKSPIDGKFYCLRSSSGSSPPAKQSNDACLSKVTVGSPTKVTGEDLMRREISQNGPIVCTLTYKQLSSGRKSGWTLDSGNGRSWVVDDYFVATPALDGTEYSVDLKGALGHAVIVYGFGESLQTGTRYWEVQNSWGKGWGNQGRLRILRGANAWNIERFCVAAPVQA